MTPATDSADETTAMRLGHDIMSDYHEHAVSSPSAAAAAHARDHSHCQPHMSIQSNMDIDAASSSLTPAVEFVHHSHQHSLPPSYSTQQHSPRDFYQQHAYEQQREREDQQRQLLSKINCKSDFPEVDNYCFDLEPLYRHLPVQPQSGYYCAQEPDGYLPSSNSDPYSMSRLRKPSRSAPTFYSVSQPYASQQPSSQPRSQQYYYYFPTSQAQHSPHNQYYTPQQSPNYSQYLPSFHQQSPQPPQSPAQQPNFQIPQPPQVCQQWLCCGCGSDNESATAWCDKCRHYTIRCTECFSY